MYGEFGEKDKALAVLSQVDQLKKQRASGYDRVPEETILYTRGNLLFWYNDLDRALADIQAVTAKAATLDLKPASTRGCAWGRSTT